ncbi:hypothetical protein A33M_3276 [Rhodovulum sp. PH10]|uniref:hypothetical protein n=1 Tax=Rhodovulum sp. PH10 TaxID=1187851 RepID=UPI00027C269D|nr:hypothetical protein [Rhodovulum sp. PH10]EJW11310.1 hypothetical protein A33M_3276 [Rhodovulum sp. PH10]
MDTSSTTASTASPATGATTRKIVRRLHAGAGTIAFATILLFWTSTVWSELFTDAATVAAVKRTIAWALLLLVPALALTGASGFRLAGRHGGALVERKRRRMPLIAANGVLVLVPCALVLATLSARGDFGPTFQAVQALELIAGATNLLLIGRNFRDGFLLARAG